MSDEAMCSIDDIHQPNFYEPTVNEWIASCFKSQRKKQSRHTLIVLNCPESNAR